jgi:hypothetical protein
MGTTDHLKRPDFENVKGWSLKSRIVILEYFDDIFEVLEFFENLNKSGCSVFVLVIFKKTKTKTTKQMNQFNKSKFTKFTQLQKKKITWSP